MKIFLVMILMMSTFLSCSRQEDGFAPSTPKPDMDQTISQQINYKNGETIINQNGWEATLDTTDPVERQLTTNGWMIEVKYE